MTGAAVSCGLGVALVVVASGAVWRLAGPPDRRARPRQRTNAVLHLLMAAGMAAMLVEPGGAAARGLGLLFGATGVAMLARGRLHHAVMSGIMVLMVCVPSGSGPAEAMGAAPMRAAPMSMPMAMSPTGQSASLLLLAAFGYAAVSACVFTWRMPVSAAHGEVDEASGRPACAVDPLGRGCEILMLVSTAVMLLPMI